MKEIKIEKLVEFVTDELDFAFIDQVNEDGEPYEVIYAGENVNFMDSYPIKLEEIEKQIKRLKNANCNYISFNYDADHYQYIIEGSKVS